MAEDSIEFELERAYDRDELAGTLRAFADALEADRPLELTDGDRTAAISIPPRVVAEFEAERDADDEPPVAELELELEWDDPDGSTIRLEDAEPDDGDEPGIVADEVAATDDPPEDPAAATMPPDAVAGGSDSEDRGEGEDPTAQRERTSTFEVYEDRAGEWRWRLVHWNGNIVADSGEGYSSRSNARRAARGVMRAAPTANVEDRED